MYYYYVLHCIYICMQILIRDLELINLGKKTQDKNPNPFKKFITKMFVLTVTYFFLSTFQFGHFLIDRQVYS